jgi:hypothetical protein
MLAKELLIAKKTSKSRKKVIKRLRYKKLRNKTAFPFSLWNFREKYYITYYIL